MDDRVPDGTRIISAADVRKHIDMLEVINGVETAFCKHHRGETTMPPKSYVELPDIDGDFRSMPAQVGDSAGVKWVNVHPDNPERFRLPTVMGLVIYSDPETAYPLAVIDGTELTRYRTGAAAGVATRYLARRGADSLGLLGTGIQARTQLAAVASVLDLERVVVSDLDDSALEAFIEAESDRDCDIVRGTPQELCECDVISTTTPSREPILEADWVREGTHINAMGADAAGKQELDPALLAQAAVVVDDWEQCSHSGEINTSVQSGTFTRGDVAATMGEVVSGSPESLRNSTTVFDSTGLAIQDIATAKQVYTTAEETGTGSVVDIVLS
ncbi:ornithine cyclodeaminase family protein [Halomarina halobia]|uniref:Alanine dehydrogenase n=1 Tax=Halomarina halobia TaxID=3033386 RepID=A0ABD6ACH0_9EURY|nr:ornithine cyclodeaminase family protein [Halomarina sp. PSR21]